MIHIGNDKIRSNNVNLDANYGPYESPSAAHATLADNEKNKIGVTVGVIENNTITEYWYQGGTTEQHLVKKQSAEITVDNELSEESENPVQNKVIKNALDLKAPSTGILKAALEESVQTSLGKADSALQSFTETDPTVPSWAKTPSKPTYTATEVGAIPVPSNSPSSDKVLGYENGAVAWVEKPQDGAQGPQGSPGHNPCLGRFSAVPSTFSETPRAGDYYYVDTVTDATTNPPTVETKIYKYNGTAWDAGTVVDVSNLSFGSGQSVPDIFVKDLDGNNDPNADGVLSADAVKAMMQRIYAESNYTNGKLFTQNGTESSATDEKFSIALDTVPIEIGTAYRWYSELPPSGTNLCLRRIISGNEPQYNAWTFQSIQTDEFGTYRQFTPTGTAGYFQMAFYGNASKAKLCKSVNGSWETVWQPQGNGMIGFLDNKIASTNTKIGALSTLTVQDKTSICTALNKVAKTAGLVYWASNTVVGSNTAILYQRDFSAYAGKTVYILCVCENMQEFLSTDASFRYESGKHISYFTIFKNGVSKVSVPSTCKMVNISGRKEDSTMAMSLTVYISEDASIYANIQRITTALEHLNVDVNGGEYSVFKGDYEYTDVSWADKNHYINPTGGLVSDVDWRISSPFVLKKGQTAYIETQGSGVCVVAKVTENEGTTTYTPLKSIPSGASAGVHDYSYTATADTLIVVSAKAGNAGAFVKLIDSGLYNRIGVVEDRLDEGRSERIHSTAVGYFTTTGAVQTSKRINWADAGWVYCPEYIPVNSGDSIKINFGKYDASGKQCIIGYDSTKTKNHNWAPVPGSTDGTRTISCPSDMSYIRICFFKEWVGSSLPDGITEGDLNTTPLVINGVPYVIDDITMLNSHDALSYPVIDNFGLIGKYYPKEVDDIKSLLDITPPGASNNYHRFHFLHISDTHGDGGQKIFGYANDLLTYADAKFLVHTGDIVKSLFSNGVSQSTIDAINSCTKPFYWVLGNHDYGSVGAGGHPAVFTQYMAPMNTHNEVDGVNGETVDKTYYSIDYSTEKVKCIFLDMNDGWSDTEIGDRNVNQTTAGKMSGTQINWFIQELQDAATNNLHVCCFIHTTPDEQDYDLSVKDWCDVRNSAGKDVTSQQAFLAEIVDAFISKTSAAFTYNGVSYTADFSAKAGHFICWFCGHTHYDNAGFMKGHEKQFIINVARPQNYGDYSGGYLGDGVGVQFNYVTIDTNTKSLAVYRVGCQNTIFATTRKGFRVLYG